MEQFCFKIVEAYTYKKYISRGRLVFNYEVQGRLKLSMDTGKYQHSKIGVKNVKIVHPNSVYVWPRS